ncbi:MAG: type IV secretion system DNA-binding domain-containing protein [Xanthomonadales bacterium]|nr:type IV secretion system DNA-binding domain-containing protein [Xanthomonadales bacterium]
MKTYDEENKLERQREDAARRAWWKFPRMPLAEAKALATGQAAQYSERQRKGKAPGIKIGGVELARTQETRHIVVVGTTGSGKTALLTGLIDQALARGDRLVLHDPKGDYSAKYYTPESVVLLGPWDERSAMWDAASDIATPALADARRVQAWRKHVLHRVAASVAAAELVGDFPAVHKLPRRERPGSIGHQWDWAREVAGADEPVGHGLTEARHCERGGPADDGELVGCTWLHAYVSISCHQWSLSSAYRAHYRDNLPE